MQRCLLKEIEEETRFAIPPDKIDLNNCPGFYYYDPFNQQNYLQFAQLKIINLAIIKTIFNDPIIIAHLKDLPSDYTETIDIGFFSLQRFREMIFEQIFDRPPEQQKIFDDSILFAL